MFCVPEKVAEMPLAPFWSKRAKFLIFEKHLAKFPKPMSTLPPPAIASLIGIQEAAYSDAKSHFILYIIIYYSKPN